MMTPEEESQLRERLEKLETGQRRRGRIQDALAILIIVVVFRLGAVSWEIDGEVGGQKIKASSGPGLELLMDVIKVGLPIVGSLLAAGALVPQSARAEVIAKVLNKNQ